ncbi:MAG TPA: hypothetical protein VL131_07195 [Gammaproteobacteria bacterium]|nr:hypothetical protein [Gammaproteobacteria bacterium]
MSITKSRLRWLSIVCGLGFASGSWGAPRTHLLVPAGEASELQTLAENVGGTAELMTVTGDDYLVTLGAGSPGAVHGTELYGDHRDLDVPFESLALVYYTNPSRSTKNPRPTPRENRFPRVSAVGKAERDMSCEALDVELARVAAVRWFARSFGALPYTHADAMKVHARNVGIGFGIAVAAIVVVGAMAECPVCFGGTGGWPGDAGGQSYGLSTVPPEKLRFAVTAADERIAGLLQLKSEKSCEARPALQEGSTDLELWSKVSSLTAATGAAEDADRIALLARTEAFDLLGPKAVSAPSRDISWLPSWDLLASGDGNDAGPDNVWTGSLALAGDDMVLRLLVPSVDEVREIRVPFAALQSVDLREQKRNRAVLLTLRDGQFASLRTDGDVRGLYQELRAKLHAAQLTGGVGGEDASASAATAALAALPVAPAAHGSGDELTAAQ